MALRVVIVESLPVIRAGVGLLIDAQSDMEVLAQAASADEALDAIRGPGGDGQGGGPEQVHVVALVGLGPMDDHDAYWLIRAIRAECSTASVLACGSNIDAMTVSRALYAGASGFVDLAAPPSNFLDALRRTARGEAVLEGLPQAWLGPIARGIERQRSSPSLTEREREVLSMAATGLTAREIGDRLGLRERTVTSHLGRIYRKLGASSRVGAIAAAARSGLVSMHSGD